MAEHERRVIVSNRKARYDYEILETWEAGLVLTGTEVKSLRAGKANLLDAYALLKGGEVWLLGMHINPYEHGSYANHQPDRTRKVLLQTRQILKLQGRVAERGLALIPLSVYFKGPYAKVELALARGKRQYDKRESIKRRDAEREVRQRTKRSAT
ncbi:MAG: SsrA-binding protein SmpB [Bacteroidetes bacterium]|jgi:SsrA-binding protein|nr:SsrA-binding protein SmpB [Bacteroidota bacterium]